MWKLFAVVALVTLTGCVDLFRNKVQDEIREIERYDPITGRPMKTAQVIDSRPLEVEYRAPDGKRIKRKEKRTGWFLVPPPLPEVKKEEPKAEAVPVQ